MEAHLPWLDAQWEAGARNAAALWRQLRAPGFRGSARVAAEWATRRRQADRADAQSLARTPSARTLARLMTTSRDSLSKSESVTIAAVEEGVPSLVEAREVIADFDGMVRARADAQLTAWIDRAANSLVGPFANGIRRDIAAVHAAISSPWSNGQTEGQVIRLKLVKRQMYGRAKLDRLEARLIGAA